MRYKEIDDGVMCNIDEFVGWLEGDSQKLSDQLDGLKWELYNDVPYTDPRVAEFAAAAFEDQITLLGGELFEAILPVEQYAETKMSYSTMVKGMNDFWRHLFNMALGSAPRYSNLSADGTDGPNFDYSKADPYYRDTHYEGWALSLPTPRL